MISDPVWSRIVFWRLGWAIIAGWECFDNGSMHVMRKNPARLQEYILTGLIEPDLVHPSGASPFVSRLATNVEAVVG